MEICQRHGAGIENGKEYAMIGIAKWFHNWPHIRFSFIPIENSMFDISNRNGYITSIIVFSVFMLFLCLILLLIYIIFIFLVRIRNPIKGKDVNKSDEKNIHLIETLTNTKEVQIQNVAIGWKIVLFSLALICGLSFFIGFYGVFNVYKGLNTVHNSSIDGIKFFKTVKDNVDAVDFSFGPKINGLLENLKEDINSLGIVPSLFTKIIDIMESMVSFASEASDDIIRANIPFINLSRIDIEWIPEDIEIYGNLSCGCALILVLILTGLGLAFSFAAFNSYLLGILIILALIGFILSAILMSVSLSGTIFVSDFCLDVKPFIKQELGADILYQFVVECPLDDKPLLKLLKSAEKGIISLRENYNKVFSVLKKLFDTYCTITEGAVNVGLTLFKTINKIIPVLDVPNDMNITCPSNIKDKVVKSLEGINNELDSYTNLINTLISIADCRRIDKDLYDGLNAICGEINPGVVYLLFYSILILICIIIIIFCATFVLIRSFNQSESQTKSIPKVTEKKK